MSAFLQELATQRWDDHRYYHHSLVNQSLHLLSACSFVGAYVLLFLDPPLAALLGLWVLARAGFLMPGMGAFRLAAVKCVGQRPVKTKLDP